MPSTYSGEQLNIRLAGALGPVAAATSPAQNLRDLLDYMLYGTVPIPHRVLCGVEIPDRLNDAEALKEEGKGKGCTFTTETTAEEIGNSILDQKSGGWNS